jgi:hypothetical protein
MQWLPLASVAATDTIRMLLGHPKTSAAWVRESLSPLQLESNSLLWYIRQCRSVQAVCYIRSTLNQNKLSYFWNLCVLNLIIHLTSHIQAELIELRHAVLEKQWLWSTEFHIRSLFYLTNTVCHSSDHFAGEAKDTTS